MKKIANLKGAKALNKKEQKSIHGGFTLPTEPTDCGCIVVGSGGYLEIVLADCFSPCPDGSDPVPGLGR